MGGTMLTNCKSSSEKVEDAKDKLADAKDKVIDANQELDQVIKDSIQLFKKESGEEITKYEKSLAEFKVLIANEKNDIKAIYNKKLNVLEQKNNDLKKKLADFKEDGKDKWNIFRAEFIYDMDELGLAIKDLTVKNVN